MGTAFWRDKVKEIETNTDFKTQQLPLARIKKIMKSDEDVRMISAEAPVVFAQACELFIMELTSRAWAITEENKRRTLQKSDVAQAIQQGDFYDFLVDIIPPDSSRMPGSKVDNVAMQQAHRQQLVQQQQQMVQQQMIVQQQLMVQRQQQQQQMAHQQQMAQQQQHAQQQHPHQQPRPQHHQQQQQHREEGMGGPESGLDHLALQQHMQQHEQMAQQARYDAQQRGAPREGMPPGPH